MGSKDVTIVYRRSEAEMPAWAKEKRVAKKLGVNIRYLSGPVEIIGKDKIEAVKCQLMEFNGKTGPDGRKEIKR